MADAKKPPKSPEDIQKEIQDFFKDKFGAEIFPVPLGAAPGGTGAPSKSAPAAEDEEDEDKPPEVVLRFQMTPAEVKAYLDRFVIGQETAKRTLAVAVCDHYNHVRSSLARRKEVVEGDPSMDYAKQNVILLGSTGVGKTYLIRILAQLIGVPFVKADITKFSETGYVGGDVDDLVRELVRLADGSHRLAAHGIIFLDEIDKITSASTSTGRDPSGRGVQIGLLKLMEDTDVPLRSPMDLGAQFQDLMQMRRGAVAMRTINTRHILFVVSGAFSGLEGIVEKRLSERNIGFAAAAEDVDVGEGKIGSLLARVATKDFVDYGFEPEFIARLPIRVSLGDLNEEDLYQILKSSEGSILNQYRENFKGYGIEVAFVDEALRVIAQRASEEHTGARGLMTVLESCLRDFKFHLPGTDVKRFSVSAALVRNPEEVLRAVRADPQQAAREYATAAVREFESDFAKRRGVGLRLDDAAVQMAVNVAEELERPLKEYLYATFDPHADFLRKIGEQTGLGALPVTPQILSRPGEGVDLWLGGSAATAGG